MNLKEASTYFDGVTRFNDNSFQCKCPVHNDHTASMTVSKGKKGILIHCHAGCETKSILEAVGLRESDLFYDSNVTKVIMWIRTANTYTARSDLKRTRTAKKKCCTEFSTKKKTGFNMG